MERQYCPLGEENVMVTRKAAGIGGHEERQEGIWSLDVVSVVPNSSFKINDHVAILVMNKMYQHMLENPGNEFKS